MTDADPHQASRPRPGLTLGLLALLALVVGAAGCGSGSSGTGTTAPTTPPAKAPASSHPGTPTAGPAESSPGSSITGYGAAAGGAGKVAVLSAAHSFFVAMATGNYGRLCADLARPNRQQLGAFLKDKGRPGGCAAALKAVLDPTAAADARKAADAAITSVRIKGGTAFVIFRPKGGVPSYFVMKKEAGGWKAIGLAPGTPLDPTATP